jgi:hypothetical protein
MSPGPPAPTVASMRRAGTPRQRRSFMGKAPCHKTTIVFSPCFSTLRHLLEIWISLSSVGRDCKPSSFSEGVSGNHAKNTEQILFACVRAEAGLFFWCGGRDLGGGRAAAARVQHDRESPPETLFGAKYACPADNYAATIHNEPVLGERERARSQQRSLDPPFLGLAIPTDT